MYCLKAVLNIILQYYGGTIIKPHMKEAVLSIRKFDFVYYVITCPVNMKAQYHGNYFNFLPIHNP